MTVHHSPQRTLEADQTAALIGIGGYVHPLFTDPAFPARAGFTARPVPGQAVLLLMGGLAEQTDAYDDRTLALLGFEQVRFHHAALDGDVLHVEVEDLPSLSQDGPRISRWAWRAVRLDGVVLVEAVARFLVRA